MGIKSKAQGEVITTILLILLSIVAIGIVFSFVMPFINNKIAESDCLNVVGADKITITNEVKYTCYNQSSGNVSLQVHVGDIRDKISGFIISIGIGGSSSNFRITEAGLPENVTVKSGTIIPEKNTERVYLVQINSKPDSIRLYPVLKNDKSCDSSESYNSIEICS